MLSQERKNLVAPCGIDCGICELYHCRDNKQLYEFLLSRGIPQSKLPCDGCRAIDGNCPVIPEKCKTYDCVKEKNLTFCSDCNDFPCKMLNPAADRADILPHNLKIFNLSTIKHKGIETFINESSLIKERYYKGKMKVGEGPVVN